MPQPTYNAQYNAGIIRQGLKRTPVNAYVMRCECKRIRKTIFVIVSELSCHRNYDIGHEGSITLVLKYNVGHEVQRWS